MPGNTSSDSASPPLGKMEADAACAVDVYRPKSKAGRKPKGGSRSRPITTLSAEQRARKRAADRASQRASRQRTQERIERLKKRIGELVDGAVDNSEYQALERRNLELEEELRKLKAVLDGLRAEIKVEPGLPPLSTSSVLPTPPLQPVIVPQTLPIVGATTIPTKYHPVPPPVPITAQSTRTSLSPGLSASSPGIVPSSSRTSSAASLHAHFETESPPQHKVSKNRANMSKIRSIARTSTPQTNYTILTSFIKQPSLHVWEIPPSFKQATTPVDSILYGLVEHQRTLATKGITGTKLVGPRNPSLISLVAPNSLTPVHTVAKVISELLSRITYRTFVDKLAAFMVMYPVYQWLIMQSYETYCNIPTWNLPVLSQRTTPHPVWISALGYPKLREAVIANQEKYTTEEFQFLFVANLNVNWPYGIKAALSWKDGDVTVSKAFWDHTRDVANFTVDEPFYARYPELRECIPLQSRSMSARSGSS